MATAECLLIDQRFLLQGIPWATYVALRDLPENEHVRMTYDRGRLEMVSPSKRHEQYAALIDHLIVVWTSELGIDIVSCRTMTFQRDDIERGLEPDNCYYIQHESLMRDKEEVDFAVDPPPDLAVEIDVTRRLVDEIPIYAKFGVPELWCYHDERVQVLALGPYGRYEPRSDSISLPGFAFGEMGKAIRQLRTLGETALVRSFQEWIRKNAER
jgi:Uma2 family endonuclease